MDALTTITALMQAAKLAQELALAVSSGEMTPEEADASWKRASNNWASAKNMWDNTPSGG